MKYTEKFFSFPIRVSKISFKKDENEELDMDMEWVSGKARIPFSEILGWYDSFSDERDVKDVAELGFDITILETKSMGEFTVNLPREKFEKLLNNFYDKSPMEEE